MFNDLTPSEKRLLGNSVGAQCFGLLTEQVLSGGVMLLYLNALKVNGAAILFILALCPFLMALLNVPLAFAADRIGIKQFGQWGNLFMIAGMTLVILGPNVPGNHLAWIIAGLLIHTLGSALFGTGWFALLSHVVPSHYTGRFFGVLRFSWQLVGIVFFGVVSCFFTGATPIRVYQILLAVCTAGLFVRGFFYQGIPAPPRATEAIPFFPAVVSAIRVPGYLPYLAYVFLLVFFTSKGADMLRLMGRQGLGFGDNTVLTMSVAGMVGALCGFYLGGKGVDQWGTRPLFVACHFGFGLALILFPCRALFPFPAPVLAIATSFLLGLVQASVSIAFTTETFAICSTRYRVLAMGLISSFQTLATAVSGFAFAGLLTTQALQKHWQLAGMALTDYDTVLMLFALMVVLLVITLGLVPSVIRNAKSPATGLSAASATPPIWPPPEPVLAPRS
jgi:MFS family permease